MRETSLYGETNDCLNYYHFPHVLRHVRSDKCKIWAVFLTNYFRFLGVLVLSFFQFTTTLASEPNGLKDLGRCHGVMFQFYTQMTEGGHLDNQYAKDMKSLSDETNLFVNVYVGKKFGDAEAFWKESASGMQEISDIMYNGNDPQVTRIYVQQCEYIFIEARQAQRN